MPTIARTDMNECTGASRVTRQCDRAQGSEPAARAVPGGVDEFGEGPKTSYHSSSSETTAVVIVGSETGNHNARRQTYEVGRWHNVRVTHKVTSVRVRKQGLLVGRIVHHVAICPRDISASLAFYVDGIGLDVLFDTMVTADLKTLVGAPSNQTRTVFLGDPADPNSGAVELIEIAGFDATAELPVVFGVRVGLHLISFQVAVEETLERLAQLRMGGDPRRIRTSRSRDLVAVVIDPDGTMVELLDRPMSAALLQA